MPNGTVCSSGVNKAIKHCAQTRACCQLQSNAGWRPRQENKGIVVPGRATAASLPSCGTDESSEAHGASGASTVSIWSNLGSRDRA